MNTTERRYKIYIFPNNTPWGVIKHPQKGNIYKHVVNVPSHLKEHFVKVRLNNGKDINWNDGRYYRQFRYIDELSFAFPVSYKRPESPTMDDLLASDFCAVKKPNDPRTYYYTLEVEKQDSEGVHFIATLDVFFTYHPDEYLSSTRESFISQGHEVRYLPNGTPDWKKVMKNDEPVVGSIDTILKYHSITGTDITNFKWAVVYIKKRGVGNVVANWQYQKNGTIYQIDPYTTTYIKTTNGQLDLPYAVIIFPLITSTRDFTVKIKPPLGTQAHTYTHSYLSQLVNKLGSNVEAIHLKNWYELGLGNVLDIHKRSTADGDGYNGIELEFKENSFLSLYNIYYKKLPGTTEGANTTYLDWLKTVPKSRIAPLFKKYGAKKGTEIPREVETFLGILTLGTYDIGKAIYKDYPDNTFTERVPVKGVVDEDTLEVDGYVLPKSARILWLEYIKDLTQKATSFETNEFLMVVSDLKELDKWGKYSHPVLLSGVKGTVRTGNELRFQSVAPWRQKSIDPILFHPNYYSLTLKKWNTEKYSYQFPFIKYKIKKTVDDNAPVPFYGALITVNSLYSWQPESNDNIYWIDYDKHYNSLLEGLYLNITDHLTIETQTDPLKDFIRDNKNSFNTNTYQRKALVELEGRRAKTNKDFAIVGTAAGAVGSLAGGIINPLAGLAGAVGTAISGAKNIIGAQYDIDSANMRLKHIEESRKATLDDLKNRLGTITTGQIGNIDSKIKLETDDNLNELKLVEEGLSPTHKRMLLDTVSRQGYKVAETKNVKKFINTRKRFNYVQADGVFNDITLKLSSATKQVINDAFGDGITFWHYRTKKDIEDSTREIKDYVDVRGNFVDNSEV